MKLTLYVALLWALWHLTDHFAEEGWGLESFISAPIVFAIEFVVRCSSPVPCSCGSTTAPVSACCWWRCYTPSFDASISQLSRDVVPASNATRFLIFSAVIVLFATAVIIATKGQLGRRADAVPKHTERDLDGENPPDEPAGGEDPRRSDLRDA